LTYIYCINYTTQTDLFLLTLENTKTKR